MSYHPAMFAGHRHSSSGDTMVLVCHKTLQHQVIRVLYDLKSPSCQVVICTVVVEI